MTWFAMAREVVLAEFILLFVCRQVWSTARKIGDVLDDPLAGRQDIDGYERESLNATAEVERHG